MSRKILTIGITSIIFSASLLVLLYIRYFQSYGFSPKRILLIGFLFIGLVSIFWIILKTIVTKHYSGDYVQYLRHLGFHIFLALLLSPCFMPIPHYPRSPLFQQTSKLRIHFQTTTSMGSSQLKGVWLKFDEKVYSYKDFKFSDEWEQKTEQYFLAPNSIGTLTWQGRIGENAKLSIFPLDEPVKTTITWDGNTSTYQLRDTALEVKKKSVTPTYYYFLIIITQIFLGGFIFFVFAILYNAARAKHLNIVTGILLISLSFYTVYSQFENPEIKGRLDVIQTSRHNAVINGTAGDPWQYRLLSEWLLEGILKTVKTPTNQKSINIAYVILRLLQNLLIFAGGYWYFRKLGFSDFISTIGVIYFTGSLLNSFHQSDLSFNTYFDLIFYLAAALLILNYSFSWLPFLMLFAALNRETSGLIPLMGLFILISLGWVNRNNTFLITATFGIYGGVFLALRIFYPSNGLIIPYGLNPGIELLNYNLTLGSLLLLLRFLSFAPIVGLFSYKHWKFPLHQFFIAIVPAWFLIHFVGSIISESRLFLVPQILVLIPLFLCFIEKRLPVTSTNITLSKVKGLDI